MTFFIQIVDLVLFVRAYETKRLRSPLAAAPPGKALSPYVTVGSS